MILYSLQSKTTLLTCAVYFILCRLLFYLLCFIVVVVALLICGDGLQQTRDWPGVHGGHIQLNAVCVQQRAQFHRRSRWADEHRHQRSSCNYHVSKTVVACKIKRLQKCFRAADFPRLCRGRKNVVKMFYFTCNHLLCSTCVQHAKTFAKHLQKCFSVLFYTYPPLKYFYGR